MTVEEWMELWQRDYLWLIYHRPLEYAQLVLGGSLEQYVHGKPMHGLTEE